MEVLAKVVKDSAGVAVMTKPNGGKRSLYMDLEEVKACKDLGLES